MMEKVTAERWDIVKKCFTEADVDLDGMLNCEEYCSFRKKIFECMKEKYGTEYSEYCCCPATEETEKKHWELLMKLCPN